MEHHIGLWNEKGCDKALVSELIVDGNHVEFHQRDYNSFGRHVFVCQDLHNEYTVFTNSLKGYNQSKTLENASSLNVAYALKDFSNIEDIENVREFSFAIPELIDWIDQTTIDTEYYDKVQGVFPIVNAAKIKDLPNVVLKEENPRIEIYFEWDSSFFDFGENQKTSFTLKNNPKILVCYSDDKHVSIDDIYKDINIVMQFFSLLIGYISVATDIYLYTHEDRKPSLLYINKDFSYNTRTARWPLLPATTLKSTLDNIKLYFESWYQFCIDDTFDLIRNSYFAANRKKDVFIEDLFIEYVRILEGYHLRIDKDVEIPKEFIKSLKKAINSKEGKLLLNPVFKVQEWEINSNRSKEVALWIATGFFNRLTLKDRLKFLDNKFLNILSLNAINIESQNIDFNSKDSHSIIIECYFQKIVDTRNYYAHYKSNKGKLLNTWQMSDTIDTLKALIIMILYSHMNIPIEKIREFIMRNNELGFCRGVLREKRIPNNNIIS